MDGSDNGIIDRRCAISGAFRSRVFADGHFVPQSTESMVHFGKFKTGSRVILCFLWTIKYDLFDIQINQQAKQACSEKRIIFKCEHGSEGMLKVQDGGDIVSY